MKEIIETLRLSVLHDLYTPGFGHRSLLKSNLHVAILVFSENYLDFNQKTHEENPQRHTHLLRKCFPPLAITSFNTKEEIRTSGKVNSAMFLRMEGSLSSIINWNTSHLTGT